MQEQIQKKPLSKLGYGFISGNDIPFGKDEYYLRNEQLGNLTKFRSLTSSEIAQLENCGNTSDNWANVLVADPINIALIQYCHFYGLVRIGCLEDYTLEYSDILQPVGLYNSKIISCDFGDNVSINHVHYMAHYIIGNEVMLSNINELLTTNHSKFGNGIVKNGESEDVRIWLELCNENGGRNVLPFDKMLSGDAWLWSRYREDTRWQNRLQDLTTSNYDKQRGYYGVIGDFSVIKHTAIIKDVIIGENAYIKGASKIKNVTIHSGKEGKTQIGEGCEIVNGIVGFGCRIFYGVKAVRFVMGNHSQLKYGARLINSFLGSNSTISCCEVLNALIFPFHEQHHNNSFLCAATVMGQSNIPAGATLGSNHNSRSADGEFVAARGFWPALCCNIKHSSKFASFTMLARGNYAYELDISIPFSLVSFNEGKQQLEIMIGYWFLYNMYALERNASKYQARDHRINRIQNLEYDYLAPDSVNDILNALSIIETAIETHEYIIAHEKLRELTGKEIIENYSDEVKKISVNLKGVEHSNRNVVLTKVVEGWNIFRKMLKYYGLKQLYGFLTVNSIDSLRTLNISNIESSWINVGGQLILEKSINDLKISVCDKKINSWNEIHDFYQKEGLIYPSQKMLHAFSILKKYFEIDVTILDSKAVKLLLEEYVRIEQEILKAIIASREKDYTSHFRTMMYNSKEEMDAVIGSFEDNSFIKEKTKEVDELVEKVKTIL